MTLPKPIFIRSTFFKEENFFGPPDFNKTQIYNVLSGRLSSSIHSKQTFYFQLLSSRKIKVP
jgi:hypothetical protein